jgi:hypothetical protein
VSTDLLDGGRPRRLILRKGRWYLEVARLVSTGDGVFRPHSQRIEGRAAILETLRRSKTSAALAEAAAKLVDNGAGGDASFDAVEGRWIPSGLAPSSIKQLGRSDIRTPAEAALVAELTLLRASHEGLLARVARLERKLSGDPELGTHAFVDKPVRRHADVPFVATLRQGEALEGSEPRDYDHAEPERAGFALAFAPATAVAAILTEATNEQIPIEELKTPAAEWIVSPERFRVSFLVDDTGDMAGAILLDTQAIARLGGAMANLESAEIAEQVSAGEPSPDAVGAASELCTRLAMVLNEVPGNPHVRGKALAPIEEQMPDWLSDPQSLLVCEHGSGGVVAFVSGPAS